MTKAHRQEGKSVEITGIATANIPGGSIYRKTGSTSTQGRAWIGVVTEDINATSQAATTLDGRPIVIGDGVLAEAQSGSGKGDMFIEGVFTLRLPTSGMYVNDSDPVYLNLASYNDLSGTNTVASGVTNNQLTTSPWTRHALSGAIVGFAVGASYTATSQPFTGLNVVDVKLIGLPLQGLAAIAPAN
jgi:hypothetical protein